MSRSIKARSPGHDWLEAQNANDIRLLFGWNAARDLNRHFFIQLHGNCFVVITVALQVVGASTLTHTLAGIANLSIYLKPTLPTRGQRSTAKNSILKISLFCRCRTMLDDLLIRRAHRK